jgi:hypothetical protein
MLALEVLRWWYSAGYGKLFRKLRHKLSSIGLYFSVPMLLRTLFDPWRRVISYGDNSFIDSLRAILDNTISRFVGFTVRLIVIFAASFSIMILSVIAVVVIILWPLVPIGALALILLGIFG